MEVPEYPNYPDNPDSPNKRHTSCPTQITIDTVDLDGFLTTAMIDCVAEGEFGRSSVTLTFTILREL